MGGFKCAIGIASIAAAWIIIDLTTRVNMLLQHNTHNFSSAITSYLVTPFVNALLLPPQLSSCNSLFSRKTNGCRSMTYVLKSGPIPPPQCNIHGWNSNPSILHGYWNVAEHSPSSITDGMIERELCCCCCYFVLKKNGKLKAGGTTRNYTNVCPRGWTFTPANRRLIVEIDVILDSPYWNVKLKKRMTLRYSFKMQQIPIVSREGKGRRVTHRFAVGHGNVKVRHCDGTTLPSSKGQDHWARLGDMCIKRNVLTRGCATHHNNGTRKDQDDLHASIT